MRKVLLAAFANTAMLAALTFTGCKKDAMSEKPGTTNPLLGTVTGVVQDAKGQAIAGAKVRVENDFAYFDATTNAEGKYSIKVATFGSYKAVAWAPVSYLGKNYTMRVGMAKDEDYDFFNPEQGAVRNFKLKFKGRIPDRSAEANGTGYFGNAIKFYKLGSIYGPNLESGDVVSYFLTPIGPLMDGTNGQVLQGTFDIQTNQSEYYVIDAPPGKYKVEAIVTRNGANYRVYVGTFSSQNETMEIIPEPGEYGVGTYESGFKHPGNVVYMSVR